MSKERQKVNYIAHHKNIGVMFSENEEITSSDIAIYNALFLIWNSSGWKEQISISRTEVMTLSKIGNATTYTKSLKRLSDFGYIEYIPSFNPLKGSIITMCSFDKGSGKSSDISSGNSTATTTENGSVTTSATLHKHINTLNTLTQEHINTILSFFDSLGDVEKINDCMSHLKEYVKPQKELNIEFDVFWELYGVKENRKKCEMKWSRLTDEIREKIIDHLPAYKKYKGDYMPHPLTYLNGERWNDEVRLEEVYVKPMTEYEKAVEIGKRVFS